MSPQLALSDQISDHYEVAWCLLGATFLDTEKESEVINKSIGSAGLLYLAGLYPHLYAFFSVCSVVR